MIAYFRDIARRIRLAFASTPEASTASVEAPLPEAICALPFVNLYVSPDGDLAPCCIASEVYQREGRPLNVRRDKLEDAWNSNGVRMVREKMLKNIRPSGCEICYAAEAQGKNSYRNWANEYWFGGTNSRVSFANVSSAHNQSLHVSPPRSLDVRLGNLCNLACRMCSSMFSSRIESDRVHSAWTKAEHPIDRGPNRLNVAHRSFFGHADFIQELTEFSQDATFIQIAGGEPSLAKVQRAWLENLRSSGKSRNTTLVIWTNLTSIQEDFLDLLRYFAEITFHLSIDGVEDVYEYIRFPAKWAKVEQRLALLRSSGFRNIVVFPTVQPYNMLGITDLLRWCEIQSVGARILTVQAANYLNMQGMPYSVRRLAAERIREFLADRPQLDQILASDLLALIATFDLDCPATGPQIDDFMSFTNDLDRARGQDIRRACPELYSLIAQDLGSWCGSFRFAVPPAGDYAGRSNDPNPILRI